MQLSCFVLFFSFLNVFPTLAYDSLTAQRITPYVTDSQCLIQCLVGTPLVFVEGMISGVILHPHTQTGFTEAWMVRNNGFRVTGV